MGEKEDNVTLLGKTAPTGDFGKWQEVARPGISKVTGIVRADNRAVGKDRSGHQERPESVWTARNYR